MNAARGPLGHPRQDLRYTARTLGRARGFALTAILVVALGVGANTAAFSLTDFVLFRPLPFPDADRLVTLWQSQAAATRGWSSRRPTTATGRRRPRRSSALGTYTNTAANLVGSGDPERLAGAAVSAELFPVLGVAGGARPDLRRRRRHPGERGRRRDTRPEVVLSDPLWRARSARTRASSAARSSLNEQPFTVIGVMPRGFQLSDAADRVLDAASSSTKQDYRGPQQQLPARRRPAEAGRDARASARTEMTLVARAEPARVSEGERQHDAPRSTASATSCRSSRGMLVLALERRRAVRAADRLRQPREPAAGARARPPAGAGGAHRAGRGRERLVRQLATESLVLAALGGALGVLLARPRSCRCCIASCRRTCRSPTTPGIDLRVLAFAAVLTLVTGVAFGLAPVMRTGVGRGRARPPRRARAAIGGARRRCAARS